MTDKTPNRNDKNIVLSLSPGRCGTRLLYQLAGKLVKDCYALHEGQPAFYGVDWDIRRDPEKVEAFVRDVKIPAIMEFPERNYFESGHIFGLGFFHAFLKQDVPFSVIQVHRDIREVARSLWRIKAVPGRNRKKANFLIQPGEAETLPLPGWEKMSNYQLCYWYCLEIERRKDAYRQLMDEKGLTTVDLYFGELRDFSKFKTMCDVLGFKLVDDAQPIFEEMVAVKVNQKRKYLPRFSLRPLGAQEEAVWKAIGDAGADLRESISARYEREAA